MARALLPVLDDLCLERDCEHGQECPCHIDFCLDRYSSARTAVLIDVNVAAPTVCPSAIVLHDAAGIAAFRAAQVSFR